MTVAVALCNPIDNFTRATGRKIAFGRAIGKCDKALRKELWTGYHAWLDANRLKGIEQSMKAREAASKLLLSPQ